MKQDLDAYLLNDDNSLYANKLWSVAGLIRTAQCIHFFTEEQFHPINLATMDEMFKRRQSNYIIDLKEYHNYTRGIISELANSGTYDQMSQLIDSKPIRVKVTDGKGGFCVFNHNENGVQVITIHFINPHMMSQEKYEFGLRCFNNMLDAHGATYMYWQAWLSNVCPYDKDFNPNYLTKSQLMAGMFAQLAMEHYEYGDEVAYGDEYSENDYDLAEEQE